jgi:hypothetical protein
MRRIIQACPDWCNRGEGRKEDFYLVNFQVSSGKSRAKVFNPTNAVMPGTNFAWLNPQKQDQQ